MNKKIVIGIMALIVLVLFAAFFLFAPHYKEIEMSGYTFEVPDSNAQVKNNTVNYNTYLDTENDLNIKTWACKDINDLNGSVNGSMEIGMQLGENIGNNVTYNNITLYNKSGIYTYYEPDINNSCMIIITSKNPSLIEHITETMKKPKLNVDSSMFNISDNGLIITNSTNNTTSENQTTTKKTTTKKTNKQKKSSSNGAYIENPEANGYISVGEGVYRSKKDGQIYSEHGRGNLKRSPELDHYYN